MRHALVFGATGGIGQAICEKLAADGFSLYIHYAHQKDAAIILQKSLQIQYPQQEFFVVSLNMTALLPEDLLIFSQQIFALDTIVFAQGNSWYGLTSEMPAEIMTNLWRLHLETPIRILQLFEKKLAQAPFARVIFIGSIYGQTGSAMEAVYASVKAAQVGFCKSYAKEVATLGITVNVVAPGAVQTPLLKDFTTEEITDLKENIPVLRLAAPAEIAFFVQMIAHKEASYLTGSLVSVDGAWNG
ncbi:elongation factor P 5-aminopentanone reductase [Enterococcus timonensis]|uniref:elongation factor P 5-aminopentanone reductase n=1 Tax=Enterococcus timonensis TaxID=1852364 RepID=UPI0008DB1D1B|nr:SDR family NAD(P)-dependent oxidoreductase [Enterococcus timonensis]